MAAGPGSICNQRGNPLFWHLPEGLSLREAIEDRSGAGKVFKDCQQLHLRANQDNQAGREKRDAGRCSGSLSKGVPRVVLEAQLEALQLQFRNELEETNVWIPVHRAARWSDRLGMCRLFGMPSWPWSKESKKLALKAPPRTRTESRMTSEHGPFCLYWLQLGKACQSINKCSCAPADSGLLLRDSRHPGLKQTRVHWIPLDTTCQQPQRHWTMWSATFETASIREVLLLVLDSSLTGWMAEADRNKAEATNCTSATVSLISMIFAVCTGSSRAAS